MDKDEVRMPVKCPKCNKKGLVAMYNRKDQAMQLACSATEDEHERFIPGCNEIVFSLGMTETNFRMLCNNPEFQKHFIVMSVFHF